MEWFLFETRKGTSLHFNSALALMARSVGIPTRLVAGWVLGGSDPGEQTVYADMAHVWMEVRIGDLGWVPFDIAPEGSAPYG